MGGTLPLGRLKKGEGAWSGKGGEILDLFPGERGQRGE